MSIAIFCADCHATGEVERVTPGLMCRCGSANLGLDGVDPKPSIHTAAPTGPGTGWGRPRPDPTAGWDQYQGPPPTPNPYGPRDGNHPEDSCPECLGSGYDLIDKCPCRACFGTGRRNPTTSAPADATHPLTWDSHQGPPAGGARWQGTATRQITYPAGSPTPESTQTGHGPGTRVSRAQSHATPHPSVSAQPTPVRAPGDTSAPRTAAHFPLVTASCPKCGQRNATQLTADLANHAWWDCRRCGGLADLDRHPEIDPFDPPPALPSERRRKASRLRRAPKPDGRLFPMLDAITAANDISPREALTLARRALTAHPE
jgi:hypothetical protein